MNESDDMSSKMAEAMEKTQAILMQKNKTKPRSTATIEKVQNGFIVATSSRTALETAQEVFVFATFKEAIAKVAELMGEEL